MAEPVRRGEVRRLGDRFVHAAALDGLKLLMMSTVSGFHQENPLVTGIGKEALREQVDAPVDIFAAALEMLLELSQA